jgi:transposase
LPPEFQPLFRSTTSTHPFGSPLLSIHHRVDGFPALSFHPPRREGPRNHPHEIGGVGGVGHAVDKALYALRNRIERFFNRAKNSRRVATRHDKLMESFAAFVLLACIRIWIKFVHTT